MRDAWEERLTVVDSLGGFRLRNRLAVRLSTLSSPVRSEDNEVRAAPASRFAPPSGSGFATAENSARDHGLVSRVTRTASWLGFGKRSGQRNLPEALGYTASARPRSVELAQHCANGLVAHGELRRQGAQAPSPGEGADCCLVCLRQLTWASAVAPGSVVVTPRAGRPPRGERGRNGSKVGHRDADRPAGKVLKVLNRPPADTARSILTPQAPAHDWGPCRVGLNPETWSASRVSMNES